MRINIKPGEKKKKNKNVDIFLFYFNECVFFVVLVIARYGSDVEDDSDEESEDENAEVKINEMFSFSVYRIYL